MAALVERIDATVDRRAPELPARVADVLAEALRAGLDLPASVKQPDPTRYRQHVLHVDPVRAYGVAALVWLPGQRTSVHDHRDWCVVGVVTGIETEERFRRVPSVRGDALELIDVLQHAPGSVQVLVPPDDVHRVRNGGATTAISLHVYGTDLAAHGTSILRTYDGTPEAAAGS